MFITSLNKNLFHIERKLIGEQNWNKDYCWHKTNKNKKYRSFLFIFYERCGQIHTEDYSKFETSTKNCTYLNFYILMKTAEQYIRLIITIHHRANAWIQWFKTQKNITKKSSKP